jgi:hypothetical protein
MSHQTESSKVVVAHEPAVLWMALIAPVIQLVSALIFPLNDEQQGVLNALAAAVVGVVVAANVAVERALPLLVGLVQAVIAVGLAFGLELDPTAQSAFLALVGAVVAFFTRTQVTPKV